MRSPAETKKGEMKMIKDDWFDTTNSFDDAITDMQVISPGVIYRDSYRLQIRRRPEDCYLPYAQMAQLFQEYCKLKIKAEEMQSALNRLAEFAKEPSNDK